MPKEKRPRGERAPLPANLIIIAIAAAVYLALVSPVSVMTAAGASNLPKYRGTDADSVSLVCAVSWKASAMEDILAALENAGERITFAVTPSLGEARPELLLTIVSRGHELALLAENGGKSAFSVSEMEEAASLFENVTGERPKLFFCASESAERNAKSAKKAGLICVVGTADLNCASGGAEEIEERLSRTVSGGGVYIVSPTRALAEALPELLKIIKNSGLLIVTAHKMLYN